MTRLAFPFLFNACILTLAQSVDLLEWTPLPPIPDELGVAGPYTGVHSDFLLVAGGANFPAPVWESNKVWHDSIYGLSLDDENANWKTVGQLPRPLGYGACVSVPEGVVCIGGNDSGVVYDSVFLLSWNGESVVIDDSLPPLPQPLCYSVAAMIGSYIYVAGGQTGLGLETAGEIFWRLDWSKRGDESAFRWEILEGWQGEPRAFSTLVAQSNGKTECLYLIGGRHLDAKGKTKFLGEVHEFNPANEAWRRRADMPTASAAGTAAAIGEDRIFVLAGADGSLFEKSDELKNGHPGFPKMVWAYDTITDTWFKAGAMPQNQVTTHAVKWGDMVLLASGEVRPRVRTPAVWRIEAR